MRPTLLSIPLSLAALIVSLSWLHSQKMVSFGMAPVRNRSEIASKTLASLKLVRIPAKEKTFSMGSSEKEQDWVTKTFFDGKRPPMLNREKAHNVTLTADYYLGVTTVTLGQFAAFVKDEKYKTEAEKAEAKYTWLNPGIDQTDDHPVVLVSYQDAQAFCRWLSRKDGTEYRLPTEAEWEYACRAATETPYFFGDDPSKLGDYAWFEDNSKENTHPVGTKKPNAWGLHDMNGNVCQWCADWYGIYATEAVTDPQGPTEGSLRVCRGSGWNSHSRDCRSANRNAYGPSSRGSYLGFRIALPK